jgi:hypothetical protein
MSDNEQYWITAHNNIRDVLATAKIPVELAVDGNLITVSLSDGIRGRPVVFHLRAEPYYWETNVPSGSGSRKKETWPVGDSRASAEILTALRREYDRRQNS